MNSLLAFKNSLHCICYVTVSVHQRSSAKTVLLLPNPRVTPQVCMWYAEQMMVKSQSLTRTHSTLTMKLASQLKRKSTIRKLWKRARDYEMSVILWQFSKFQLIGTLQIQTLTYLHTLSISEIFFFPHPVFLAYNNIACRHFRNARWIWPQTGL